MANTSDSPEPSIAAAVPVSTNWNETHEAAPPSGTPGEGEGPADEAWLALLRRLRAEVQDLRGVIALVQAGTSTLQAQNAYLTKTKTDLEQIHRQLAENPDGNDTVHHLLNMLEQMEHNPLFSPPEEELSGQAQTHATTLLLADIRRIERLVGLLTIPTRLNEWLEKSRPGYYIPFHLVFKDEIPNEDDRRTVLNHLAWSPEVVKNGIVDVTNGLVFRYAEESTVRRRSLGWLALGILLSLLVVVGAAYVLFPTLSLPERADQAAAFVIGWLSVVVGVVAHIGVEGAKRERQTRLPTILAVTDLRKIIDARLGQILWKLLLVLIGFFAVAFAIDPGSVSPANGFLVGYSLDSIVGVFGASIETKVKSVEEQLNVRG